jgi:hypothetical protein
MEAREKERVGHYLKDCSYSLVASSHQRRAVSTLDHVQRL